MYIISFGEEIPREDPDDEDELEEYVKDLCDWDYSRNVNDDLTAWRYYQVRSHSIAFATNAPIHADFKKYYEDMKKKFPKLKLMYANEDINVPAYAYFYEQSPAHNRLLGLYAEIVNGYNDHKARNADELVDNIQSAIDEIELD
jgi:hypothetical protein